MSQEINLLIKKQIFSPELLDLAKIIRRVAIITLAIFIILILAVFSVQFFFIREQNQIQSRINNAKTQIEKAKATESLYLVFIQKVASVDDIINQRIYPTDVIRKINQALPTDVKITSFGFNSKSFSLSIEAPTLEILDLVISSLRNNIRLAIKDITMQGLEKDKNVYKANFQFTFSSQK